MEKDVVATAGPAGPAVVATGAELRCDNTSNGEHTMSSGNASGQVETDLSTRVRGVVESHVTAAEAELVDVEIKGQKGSRTVRLLCDRDGGLDIDVITRISRSIGDDLNDVVPGRFTLEVTSPGATRPLKTGRDFRRNIGREVRVQRLGQSELSGTVVGADDDTLTLDVDGNETTIDIADVSHGKVVLPW